MTTATTMTTDAMLAELRIVFPTLWTRPLREFNPKYTEGIWTGADGSYTMPDGDPIFDTCRNGDPPYNGPIHEGFEAWLSARGWYFESYDGGTFFLVPDSYFHLPAEVD